MPDDTTINSIIEENVEINRLLQRQAEVGLTTLHRPLEQIGVIVGRPAFIVSVLGLFGLWIVVNLGIKLEGRHPWDEPPFYWLQGFIGFLSLVVAATVLVAQGRQGQLAEQRAQLQLQIILLTEQRTAKLVGLMEELRHDMPDVHDRHDAQAEVMQQASDPGAIIEALETLDSGGPTSLPPGPST
ncbi:DUF1003 domain-containing protein [Deinococcus pimensis]|uniref:DUF1003 domain-containing protein n=1 Tax=Deinococcus pimensis TaxID=309888 RepID=UPI0004B87FED|nr:DUF1003 domain-containing protein [Deinococcus pimensis]